MRILYLSDGYGGVAGTKRSLLEELKRRGIDIIYRNKGEILNIVELVKVHDPDQVWLVHSGLLLPVEKSMIGKPVVGFGFSDPYYFSEKRFNSYDFYITNHFETWRKYYKGTIPMLYNPTACDLRFHKSNGMKKDIDISCIGLGEHPRFKDRELRLKIIEQLRRDTSFTIHAYGNFWPIHNENFGHVEGTDFLDVINRSRIGLDIEDYESPLAHRMMEYGACGTPIIAREREEIKRVFVPGKEILTYGSYEELRLMLDYYLSKPKKLIEIGQRAKDRCLKDHDISTRVNKIMGFLEGAT